MGLLKSIFLSFINNCSNFVTFSNKLFSVARNKISIESTCLKVCCSHSILLFSYIKLVRRLISVFLKLSLRYRLFRGFIYNRLLIKFINLLCLPRPKLVCLKICAIWSLSFFEFALVELYKETNLFSLGCYLSIL